MIVLAIIGTSMAWVLAEFWKNSPEVPTTNASSKGPWVTLDVHRFRDKEYLLLGAGPGGTVVGLSDNATWVLSDNWRKLSPSLNPSQAWGGKMAYDSKRGVTVFLAENSDTWEWDGREWHRIAVPGPALAGKIGAIGFDPLTGLTVMCGDRDPSGTEGLRIEDLRDTWVYDGRQWRDLPDAQLPKDMAPLAMAFSPANRKMLLICELHSSNSSATWLFEGNSWSRVQPKKIPTITGGTAAASGEDCLVVVSNTNWPNAPNQMETWRWNSEDWVAIHGSPSGRDKFGFAYHAQSRRFVLCGGVRWELIETAGRPIFDIKDHPSETWALDCSMSDDH